MVSLSINNKSLIEIIKDFSSHNLDSDQIFISSGVSWIIYENLLNYLGDYSNFRVIYNQGILQVMSPSSRHEIDKKMLGILVENYCLEKGIRFYPLGSTTLKSQKIAKGIEPDQCYCIGSKKEIPDLAIEVVITSGGIETLSIYKGLGVFEVWFWENRHLEVYYLHNGEYIQGEKSQLFPNLNLSLLTNYLESDEPFDAVLEFREKLKDFD